MKNTQIFSNSLFLLIVLFCFQGFSQTQSAASFIFPPAPAYQEYKARDIVKMQPGFSYTADGSNNFKAWIDETQVLPAGYNPSPLTDDPANIAIDYSLPVASISGNASVSNSGAALYSVPISLPPGTKGVVPNISIVHSSQMGNGILGLGWNISGLSSISRIAQTHYLYQNPTAVDLTPSDRFALNGNRLVLDDDQTCAYGAVNAEYKTVEETSSEITSYGTAGTGPLWFELQNPDGSIVEYGNTTDSRFTLSDNSSDNSTVLEWKVNKITDKNGNYIKFHYVTTDNEIVIDKIEYTGNSNANMLPYNTIQFLYEEKEDKSFYYLAGYKINQKKVLRKIKIFAESQIRDEYSFDYFYDLYSNTTKLNAIKQTVNGTSEINSTKIIWVADNFAGTAEFTQPAFNMTAGINASDKHKYTTGDFNGDGKSDILVAEGSTAGSTFTLTKWLLYLSDNASTNSFTTIEYNTTLAGFISYTAIDINNDGTDEIIVKSTGTGGTENNTIFRYDTDLANWTQLNPAISQGDLSTAANSVFVTLPANNVNVDFNGDGKNDIFSMAADASSINKILISNTNSLSFDDKTFTSISARLINPIIKLVDYNGNGKTDIMVLHGTGTIIYEYSSGSFSSICTDTYPTSYGNVLTGDFNGDNKTDMLVFENYFGKDSWLFYYSLGVDASGVNGFSAPLRTTSVDLLGANNRFTVADINKDGRDDVIETKSNNTVNVYLSNTTSFRKVTNTTVNSNYNYPISFGDFNGDGKKDILKSTHANNSTMSVIYFRPFDNSNYVASIYDGFKNKYSYTYKPLTDNSVYTKRDKCPASHASNPIQPALYVVSDFAFIDNMNNTCFNNNYFYEGFVVNRADNYRFLGFDFITKTNAVANTKTEIFFQNIGFLFKHYAKNERNFINCSESSTPDWQEISYTNNGTYIARTIPYNSTNPDATRYSYYSGHSEGANYLNNAHWNRHIDTHSDHPKVKSVKAIYGPNTRMLIETYIEKNTDAYPNWQSANVLSESITKIGRSSHNNYAPMPKYERTKKYTYDTDGNRIKEQMDIDDPDNDIATEYSNFNVFGEPTVIKTIPPTNNDPSGDYSVNTITEILEYDAKGRYITKRTIEDSDRDFVTTYSYEPKYGNLISTTDANSLTTTYVYDNLGRKIKTIYPDQTEENTTYNWSTQQSIVDPANAIFKVTTSTSGNPDIVQWFDGLNRNILTQNTNLNNTKVYVKTNYNNKGQLSSVSLPYEEGTPASNIKWTTCTYDCIGRKLMEYYPDGTSVENEYPAVNTTIVKTTKNGNTQQRVYEKNYRGQNISVTDNNNVTTYYRYNSAELLIETGFKDFDQMSPNGGSKIPGPNLSRTTLNYNLHGKRTAMGGPNIGNITSEYDGYGRLIKQTENNKESLMTYDDYGRILTRTTNEALGSTPHVTTWEYDTRPYGLGKVSSITNNNTSTATEYYYDEYGRLVNTNEVIDGQDYTQLREYDSYGRLSKLTYPNDFAALYTYENGQLHEVKKATDGSLIWHATAQDNFGNYTAYTSGNGNGALTTTKTFDVNTGRIKHIKTGVNPNIVQEIDLSYDDFGNISERTDVKNNQGEVFHYDNLNRLTEIIPWEGTSLMSTRTIAYNDIGNITQKTDAGNMTYYETHDPYCPVCGRMNAVSTITNPSATINTDQDISYTSYNKASTITETGQNGVINEVSFVYGVDYGRRIMTTKANNSITSTRYYTHGNYEKTVNATTAEVTEDCYIFAGDGLAAIYRSSSTTGNKMYYIHKDHLGSFDVITNESGTVVDKYAFDAWGNRRNHDSWSLADNATHLFDRGYTGHEHLDKFKIINMNGRLYDPVVARFLSPDPFVQNLFNSQNLNRYSYCLNNPLKYTDPSGYAYLTWDQQVALSESIDRINRELQWERYYWFKSLDRFRDLFYFSGSGGEMSYGGGSWNSMGTSGIFSADGSSYLHTNYTNGIYSNVITNSAGMQNVITHFSSSVNKPGNYWSPSEIAEAKIRGSYSVGGMSFGDPPGWDMRAYYKSEMKANPFFSKYFINAALNYYFNATENEEKFVAAAEKPLVVVGKAIANMTPVAFGMNLYSLFQSGWKNDMWGPANNLDHTNNGLNALNYGLYFIPGASGTYGIIFDGASFSIDVINGVNK